MMTWRVRMGERKKLLAIMCRKSETKFVTQRNDVTLEFSRNHDSFTSFEEISKSN